MNVMLIAVSQRVREIGLLKALGAPASQIRNLFFAEAILLSGIGSVAGLVLGEIGTRVIAQIYPALPVAAPWWRCSRHSARARHRHPVQRLAGAPRGKARPGDGAGEELKCYFPT